MTNLVIEPVVNGDPSLPEFQQVIAKPNNDTNNKKQPKTNPKKNRSRAKKKVAKKIHDSDDNSINDEIEAHQVVKCVTSFKLFIRDQAKSKSTPGGIKKKVWISVGPEKSFNIELKVAPESDAIVFEDFIEKVATACELSVPNTAARIRDSINCDSPKIDIKWEASIPRVNGFKKNDHFVISNKETFQSWIETLAEVGGTEAGLSLEMPNPKHAANRIHQAQLLAKVALREESAQSNKRKHKEPNEGSSASDSDPEADEEHDTDDIKLCMRKIYTKHPANVLYDRRIPVYVHPIDPDKYILLSHEACQDWARAILLPTEGVSYNSPPKSLKFACLSAKQQKAHENPDLTQAHNNYFRTCPVGPPMRAFGGGDYHPTESDCSSAASPEEPHNCIQDYVNFIGLGNHPKKIADLLAAHDIKSYKMFKSKNLDHKELYRIGLTIGIVTQLIDNVGKFARHLSNSSE